MSKNNKHYENSEAKKVIDRLRGQLQNCVAHLERANRYIHNGGYDQCIESANRALYETLNYIDAPFAYVKVQDVADWLYEQRNDIPMTGEEAAGGFLYSVDNNELNIKLI